MSKKYTGFICRISGPDVKAEIEAAFNIDNQKDYEVYGDIDNRVSIGNARLCIDDVNRAVRADITMDAGYAFNHPQLYGTVIIATSEMTKEGAPADIQGVLLDGIRRWEEQEEFREVQ